MMGPALKEHGGVGYCYPGCPDAHINPLKFLKNIGDTAGEAWFHAIYGVASGIPPCCVQQFIEDLMGDGVGVAYRRQAIWGEWDMKRWDPIVEEYIQYVPCDLCLAIDQEKDVTLT